MAGLTPPMPHNFSARLKQASRILGASVDELVSIKIRPIAEAGEFETLYLGASDYDAINQSLANATLGVEELGPGYGGFARLCKLHENNACLYIEHESGPEIIIHLITMSAGAAAASFFALNQAIKLINNLARFLRKRNPRRDNRGKFIAASIEKRTSRGLKVIRQIGKTAKAAERAIKSIEELLR
jgi:hypothetical protein